MAECISRARRVAGVAVLLALAPRAALACPVCGLAGVNENWAVYLAMTAVLSALPLLMIGGMVAWLYRRAQKDRATLQAASDSQCSPRERPIRRLSWS